MSGTSAAPWEAGTPTIPLGGLSMDNEVWAGAPIAAVRESQTQVC